MLALIKRHTCTYLAALSPCQENKASEFVLNIAITTKRFLFSFLLSNWGSLRTGIQAAKFYVTHPSRLHSASHSKFGIKTKTSNIPIVVQQVPINNYIKKKPRLLYPF